MVLSAREYFQTWISETKSCSKCDWRVWFIGWWGWCCLQSVGKTSAVSHCYFEWKFCNLKNVLWYCNIVLDYYSIILRVPAMVQWVKNLTAVTWVVAEVWVQSLIQFSELKDWYCRTCGSHSIPGLGTSICRRMAIIVIIIWIILV